ncbi:MAG: hypothetical protein ACI4PE_00950 [Bacilli bacterium]
MKKLFKKSNKCSSGGANLTKTSINNEDNKRRKVTISLVIILLMLCVGISFAVWNYGFLGQINKLETGEISLELLESNTNLINITNQLPISDNEGKTLDTFDFAVTTKASRDMNLGYEIKIEKLSASSGYTSLNDSQVKVYLTDYSDNELISPTKISELSNYSLYGKTNTHSKDLTKITDKFKLRVWIDGETDASSWDENTKLEYKFKIGVNGGENFLTGLTKTIADNSVLDNVSSTYVSSSTGINFAEAPSDTNGKGIYQRAGTGTNGEYPIYYYRGEVNNNNVAFNNFCWKIVRTTETGGIKLIYNGEYDGSCNNTGDASTIGDSEFNYIESAAPLSNNENSDVSVTTLEKQGEEENIKSRQIAAVAETTSSPADVGYMYGTRYTKYSVNMSGNTNTIIYGNDVTYSNGTYTLKDTITSTSYDADYKTIGNNHHYTCFNEGDSCSEVYYIYFSESGYVYSLLLTGGVNIDEALNEMLTNSSNANDSTIKSYIDNWYSENMNSKTSLLEDTIWCNDRSIYNIGGFNKDTNADVTNATDDNTLLSFKIEEIIDWYDSGKAINPSVKCTNKNDSFTVGTKGNGKLTYPVGLLTGEEATLAGHGLPGYSESSYLTTGSWYWLSSPFDFYDYGAYVSGVDSDGALDYDVVDFAIGVRPSISLKLGTTPSGGDGTVNNPYLIETEYKETPPV